MLIYGTDFSIIKTESQFTDLIVAPSGNCCLLWHVTNLLNIAHNRLQTADSARNEVND